MNLSSHLQVGGKTSIQKVDWNLVFVLLAINFIALVNLFSATSKPGAMTSNPMFISQVMWLILGWAIFFVLTFFDYRLILKLTPLIYLGNIAALILVMFVGHSSHSAQRWLDLGFFKYQPSETMKLALVFALTSLLALKRGRKHLDFVDLIIPLLLMGVPVVLTIKQPDLGTSLLLVAIAAVVLFFVGIKKRVLITAALLASIALPSLWVFVMKPYQKQRVMTFLNPAQDPRGAGYNSIQAKIAIGSGKLFGKGYRKGTQSQLEFLPERSTDFIFCVLSEEHGFVGSLSVLGLFSILLTLILRIASLAKDLHGSLLCIGVAATLFWHMFVNIGMVLGLLPVVGVPLPIFSYGGTITTTAMIGLGLVSSVSYRRNLF